MSATQIAPPPIQSDPQVPESPLARLTPEQIEQLGREFDAIHDEVYADLGERDARYIRNVIKLHRQLVLAARAPPPLTPRNATKLPPKLVPAARARLLAPRRKPLWLAGTAALSLAKI